MQEHFGGAVHVEYLAAWAPLEATARLARARGGAVPVVLGTRDCHLGSCLSQGPRFLGRLPGRRPSHAGDRFLTITAPSSASIGDREFALPPLKGSGAMPDSRNRPVSRMPALNDAGAATRRPVTPHLSRNRKAPRLRPKQLRSATSRTNLFFVFAWPRKLEVQRIK